MSSILQARKMKETVMEAVLHRRFCLLSRLYSGGLITGVIDSFSLERSAFPSHPLRSHGNCVCRVNQRRDAKSSEASAGGWGTGVGVGQATSPFIFCIRWVWHLFLVVKGTTSGMNYNPEMEGTPVIQILKLEDTGFWLRYWQASIKCLFFFFKCCLGHGVLSQQ